MSLLLKQCTPLLRTHKYYKTRILQSSTKVATKESVEANRKEKDENAIRTFEKVSKIYQKISNKKPQKPPFVKNMFLGVVDTDLLAYPEPLNKEELHRLDSSLEPVKQFYTQLRRAEEEIGVSRENCKQLNLFGLQASQIVGGRQLNVTETCRFYEYISKDFSDISLLNSEQFGVQALLKVGNEKQLNKYLEELVAGKSITAFCTSDEAILKNQCFAKHNATKNTWILNGEKHFVVNGDTADLLIVMAQTEFLNRIHLTEIKPTVFLVERTFGGVTSVRSKSMGLDKSDISTVKFTNTEVPAENILGEIHQGDDILSKILTEVRLSAGIASTTIATTTLDLFVKFCKDASNDSIDLMKTDIIHKKISEMCSDIYAMESMNYLTSSLIDIYENQDCEMEAAIAKAFSVQQTHSATLNCMTFLGSPSYMHDNPFNELHRSALSYLTFGEPIDNLKIIIALQGLRHSGLSLQEDIRKIRNPMYNGLEIFKKIWTRRKNIEDDPKLILQLQNYVHPSAMIAAQWLEYCVLRLQFATEILLARHGHEIILKHMDLIRLADCIIDVYGMAASIGRASRSYCIGLQNGDYEVLLANIFCANARDRVKANVHKIFIGPFNTNDGNYNKVGSKLFEMGRYFPVHPLTRNF